MTTTTTDFAPGLRARISGIFTWFGRALNLYFEAQTRTAAFNKLMAKSDDELAAMGLKRDRIASYVFRDRMYN